MRSGGACVVPRRLSLIGMAPVLLWLVSIRVAQAQQNDPILRVVDAHYNHLTSLKASYTEHYTGLGMDRIESGTLLLRKPGRMRWTYAKPVGKVFVLDGKYAWSYVPGDAQAQRVPAKQLDDLRSPLRFLLGHTELQRELEGIIVTHDGPQIVIRGVPRGMQQRIRELRMRVEASGEIVGLRLEELDGATTEFTFTDTEENGSIPRDAFTFTPPAGVEVVNGLPPV